MPDNNMTFTLVDSPSDGPRHVYADGSSDAFDGQVRRAFHPCKLSSNHPADGPTDIPREFDMSNFSDGPPV
jgi:hypothetical protein